MKLDDFIDKLDEIQDRHGNIEVYVDLPWSESSTDKINLVTKKFEGKNEFDLFIRANQ